MHFKETINNPAIAQSKIAEMVRYGSSTVDPCSDCNYATPVGCIKESYKNGEEVELGPVYDLTEGVVVCPVQKGTLSLKSEKGTNDNDVKRKEIPLGPMNAWGKKK